MDAVIARKTWRTLEPLHSVVYFAPERSECYGVIGLKGGRMSYFASRSAAMGAVSAETVIATFYSFNPDLVRQSIPRAWELASPADILAARLEVADRALRRGLGPDVLRSPELAEAASLARAVAEAAMADLAGRPLFAGHASLAWPDQPHLVLWHAQTLLREYRGDGHVAALLVARLDPVEALVSHVASGEATAGFLATRGWPDADWAAAGARLRARRLLADSGLFEFTGAGEGLRKQIEEQTDAAAVKAYQVLGEDGCSRLRELGRPLSKAVVAAGLLNPTPGAFDD